MIAMLKDYEWFIKTDFSKYAGKWIATIDKKVVAKGDDAEVVYKEAKRKYPAKKPSLAKIPTGDTLIL
ncbi:succinyl-CoA synthetase subunit alpha [ANME-1 cluster archaeon GoMg4]|nr:succinyl-CoA synthetase subunit alpha [ANME-1 cluster archaeon GoMg4]